MADKNGMMENPAFLAWRSVSARKSMNKKADSDFSNIIKQSADEKVNQSTEANIEEDGE